MNQPATRTALVTGGATGLGRAIVDQLAKDGWRVLTVDLVKGGIKDSDHIQCDLSDRAERTALFSKLRPFAPFDLVVLNAAASASGRFEQIPFHVYDKLIRLNAETPMVMASQLHQQGLFAPKADLVFVSSLSHFTGYPGAAVYSATKDAIAIYAKSIRKPFARLGIRVTCVFPGPMQTAQADRHAPKGADASKRMLPELAAELILKSVFAGSATIIPGIAPRFFALFGRLVPGLSDRAMRRIIYEKLDRDVF